MLTKSPVGSNIVVFDCEIKNEIKGEVTWGRHDLMGVSVAAAFHYLTMEFKIFMDDNIEQLPELLNQAEIVSGFNIIEFDNKLLNATCKLQLHGQNVYDILKESRVAAGVDRFSKGMKLDDHLLGTFGPEALKTAEGAHAPIFWQEKRLGKLISYNIDDVRRECKLFEHIYAGNAIKTPNHGWRKLRMPN